MKKTFTLFLIIPLLSPSISFKNAEQLHFTSSVSNSGETYTIETSAPLDTVSRNRETIYFNTSVYSTSSINLRLYDFSCRDQYLPGNYTSTVIVDEDLSTSKTEAEIPPSNYSQYNNFPYLNPKTDLNNDNNLYQLTHDTTFRRGTVITIQNGLENGSGFFIRENLILTAAHIFINEYNSLCKPTICVNMHGTEYTYTYKGLEVLLPEEFDYKKESSKYDWALIKLDGNYGSNIGTLGYISNYKLNDSEITHVGYFDPNRGKGKDLTDMYSTSSKGIFSEDSYTATTYAYIQKGMSGGPVVNKSMCKNR